MTFYELIINVHGQNNHETISVNGMFVLATAAEYLDELAKSGQIADTQEVNVYDTVKLSSEQLSGLLKFLNRESSIVETGDCFDVYLSEV
jgi:hypothetical protein